MRGWLVLGLGLGLVGCEALGLPDLTPLEGGYEMQALGIRDVQLDGGLGPVAQLDDDLEATDGVSCPGEMYFSFDSDEPEGHARVEIALNDVVPDLAPGASYRVESFGEDRLQVLGVVTGEEASWTGESLHAELWITHLGLDVYKVGLVALMVGDTDLEERELTGTWTMDRSQQLPFVGGE